MTFGQALLAMRFGRLVRRASWPAGLHLLLVHSSIEARATDSCGASRSPWVPTQDSLLAEDWIDEGSARFIARQGAA